MAETTPRCAVIIPTYNGAALTTFCLKALLAHPPSRCQWTIVVVDDASTEPAAEKLARFEPHIQLVEQEVNTGFAGACNAGARAAGDCDHFVFLNNDTLPVAGWLDALVEEVSADERVAVVGSKLLFPNGQVQHAGVAIGQDRWPHHLYGGFPATHPAVNRAKQVAAVTAACMLVRRADFDQLGGFDTGFQNGYEDVDLCLRLASRQRLTRYCPRSVVYHLESVTRWPSGTPERTEASVALYEQRWRSIIAPDDLQHYVDDGLLELSYGPHYPVRISVSSELAVVDRDGEELVGLERVLSLRSRQVMELLSAQTRRQLKAAVGNSAVLSAPRCSTGPARRIADGSQHQLGAAESGRLISVVIPVKNGARDLEELLPLLLGQSIQARLEIVAIDSGSADDTIEVLGRFGATVLAIEPTDFDHALTRNLGAEQAAGDVLVFLSQRTRPVGERWLAPLIAQLDGDPEVVGVCSRIIARDDADVLTRKDSEHELSGSGERQRKQISDWSSYGRMSAHERRVLLNFHTVSAAIRAEALRRTPFPPVRTIGEDLLWAREVLESGWALVHEPDSVARHSHSYTLSQLFSRNVDDGIANRDIVDRSFGREEIAPMIRAIVDDDWSYLRETLGLSGAELENWQRESALRRVTQVAGQWLGVNYERLPEGTAAQFSSVAQLRAGSDADRPATR
jgi:GT2 family glycosyltransferase